MTPPIYVGVHAKSTPEFLSSCSCGTCRAGNGMDLSPGLPPAGGSLRFPDVLIGRKVLRSPRHCCDSERCHTGLPGEYHKRYGWYPPSFASAARHLLDDPGSRWRSAQKPLVVRPRCLCRGPHEVLWNRPGPAPYRLLDTEKKRFTVHTISFL